MEQIDEVLNEMPKSFWMFLTIIFVSSAVVSLLGWEVLFLSIMALFLGVFGWELWLHYIRQNFISGITWVVLEIIPPREVARSPKAMELFFTNALYHWSMKGGREAIWQGAVWFWFSLEIVSIEGQIHFYIRTPSRIKGLIETQIYAQYPQAYVKEVEDYTAAVDEISEKSEWNLWGCEWKLAKPDPYPIKTYVDFGLDKDPDEELKVDPLSPVIELFASMKKDEQMWLQIVVRPSKNKFKTHGTWGDHHDWVRECELELERVSAPWTKIDKLPNGQILKSGRTPDSMKATIDGLTKKPQKIGFDVGIRSCYVAKKHAFDLNHRRDIRLIFRQYANPVLNSLERYNGTQADAYGGLITVLSQKKVMVLANRMLHEYKERNFFNHPMRNQWLHHIPWPISPTIFMAYFHSVTYVLNVEELATLWHFPGQILKIPTLERVESKEASPPTNLPV